MKKFLSLFLIIHFVLTGAIAQQISGTKQKATLHATVKLSNITQTKGDGKIKYKTPNPHWQPPEWSYAKDKVIYRQDVLPAAAENRQTREDSPLPEMSFEGLVDNNTSIPPDVNGAAGPDHIMQTLNTEVRISDKEGNPIFTTTLSSFWSALPGSGNTFDPKIVYDPYAERWLMTTPSGSGTSSRIY
ncbi:MAG: hypothetical protein P8100_15685 [bacterium]